MQQFSQHFENEFNKFKTNASIYVFGVSVKDYKTCLPGSTYKLFSRPCFLLPTGKEQVKAFVRTVIETDDLTKVQTIIEKDRFVVDTKIYVPVNPEEEIVLRKYNAKLTLISLKGVSTLVQIDKEEPERKLFNTCSIDDFVGHIKAPIISRSVLYKSFSDDKYYKATITSTYYNVEGTYTVKICEGPKLGNIVIVNRDTPVILKKEEVDQLNYLGIKIKIISLKDEKLCSIITTPSTSMYKKEKKKLSLEVI